MRPLRLLVVYPFLVHYRYGVFSELEKTDGLEVTFVSGTAGRAGIESTPTSMVDRHKKAETIYAGRFSWQGAAIRITMFGRYDSVVFLGDAWSISTWLAAVAARLRRKTVFFWTIGWHRPETGVLRLFRLTFYKLANELLIYGNTGLALGAAMGYPEHRMTVIYNSHHSSKQLTTSPSAEGLRLAPTSDATIGAIVRLTPSKRLDLLIRAAASLADRGFPVRVVLAGEGPELTALTDLARTLGVQVDFLGAVYARQDIESLYQSLDVTVLPAAAGLTVIQSLAHGVPVITDDDIYGQMPEAEAVIDGVTGARYPRDDVSALADAISFWVTKKRHSPAVVARAAQDEVQVRWTPEAQAHRIAARVKARQVVNQ